MFSQTVTFLSHIHFLVITFLLYFEQFLTLSVFLFTTHIWVRAVSFCFFVCYLAFMKMSVFQLFTFLMHSFCSYWPFLVYSSLRFHSPSSCHLFLHIPFLSFPFFLLFNLSLFPCVFFCPPQDQGSFCCRGASWMHQTGWTRPRSCCTISRMPVDPGLVSCADDASWTRVSTSVTKRQVSWQGDMNSISSLLYQV